MKPKVLFALHVMQPKWEFHDRPLHLSTSVGRCVIPCAFFGKSVKHIFSCSKMYPD